MRELPLCSRMDKIATTNIRSARDCSSARCRCSQVRQLTLITMKRTIIVFSLISGIFCHVQAQFTTVYGNNTSSTGNSNSYFGFGIAVFGANYSNNASMGAHSLLHGGPENTAVGMS